MSQTSADAIAIIKRFVLEVQQNGNLTLIDEIFHPDFLDHESPPDTGRGPAVAHALLQMLHTNVKDIQVEILHCVSDGDIVATHKILRGVQVGELFGTPGTGNLIELRIMDFVRVKDGKAIEHWARHGPL